MPSKIFKGVLMLNWKTGAMRVTKKKPRKVLPYEIPVVIDVKVNLPEQVEIKAKGEVTVPPTKVKEMFIEAI